MTKLQKLQLEQSEKRQKVNELLALDELSDEQRGELGTLTTRLTNLETELRAAIVVEGEAEARALGMFGNGDGEAGERGRLLRETRMTEYLGAAAAGIGLTGRPAELNAALELPVVGASGGVAIPWAVLAGPEVRQAQPQGVETRAFTSTANNDGPEGQRPILQRLFGANVMGMLGVRIDSVPVGRVEWPIITGGVAPAQAKEGDAAATPVASTFGTANLKPKRLTGQYEYTHEVAASVPELEAALRRDLRDAVEAKMSDIVINGQAPTQQNPQHIEGFISELTATDDTSEATADRYGRLPSEAVDGIHAFQEGQVMCVLGTATYRHAAGKYLSGSGDSGSDLLARRSGGVLASSFIPAAQSNLQSALLHAAGPNGGGADMRGDSVAAVWAAGIELLRDPYSKVSQGVILTWISLWDVRVALRSSAYKLLGIHIG